ncbi:hypothetical protein D5400_06890 [Georhizobium profundi]|uniref:Cytochrome c domain-containing protein n=1 Tax=Georhizobium profundi TaxID=2341112 RepID=A0A3S9B269_9HYPH|nr:c-type cytochrome [Georhizobium profundi]AZN71038.1 hypothetical protein D5400_06890 [Georhizobium profundi]
MVKAFITLAAAMLAGLPVPAGAEEKAGAAADVEAYVQRVSELAVDPAYGDYLSSQCTSCHGANAAGGIPAIQGQPAEAIIAALFEYKTELRENAVMRSVASALSDEDVAALSAHFSQQ